MFEILNQPCTTQVHIYILVCIFSFISLYSDVSRALFSKHNFDETIATTATSHQIHEHVYTYVWGMGTDTGTHTAQIIATLHREFRALAVLTSTDGQRRCSFVLFAHEMIYACIYLHVLRSVCFMLYTSYTTPLLSFLALECAMCASKQMRQQHVGAPPHQPTLLMYGIRPEMLTPAVQRRQRPHLVAHRGTNETQARLRAFACTRNVISSYGWLARQPSVPGTSVAWMRETRVLVLFVCFVCVRIMFSHLGLLCAPDIRRCAEAFGVGCQEAFAGRRIQFNRILEGTRLRTECMLMRFAMRKCATDEMCTEEDGDSTTPMMMVSPRGEVNTFKLHTHNTAHKKVNIGGVGSPEDVVRWWRARVRFMIHRSGSGEYFARLLVRMHFVSVLISGLWGNT